jgi:SAM-dependent methyltransferase
MAKGKKRRHATDYRGGRRRVQGLAAGRPEVQAAVVEDADMDHSLKEALELNGPEACQAYYRDWATNYDAGFAEEMQYLLPAHVAAAFLGTGAAGPVLDVGAGTGLLAERLRDMGFRGEIDGVDLSAEMLGQAAEKRLYARLLQADITRPLHRSQRYAGIVSSGTFTAGHVGPDALPNNRRVWTSAGFDRALDALAGEGRIVALQLIEVEIYGAAAAGVDAEHAGDQAMIALFRAA